MSKKHIRCPECGKEGGIICRKDAFAIFKIIESGGYYVDTEVFDDVDGYYCQKCESEIDWGDIKHLTSW